MIIIKIIQVILVFMYAILSLPVYMLIYRLNRVAYYRAVSAGFRHVLFILGIKINVLKPENFARAGQNYLIAANHQSYLDIPVLSSIIPCTFIQRPVAFIPGFSWHFGRVTVIIERDTPASIIKVIRYIKRVALQEKTPVVIFPESTRSPDGKIGKLRIGAAAAAKNLNLPILPVTIVDSMKILPRKKNMYNYGTVRVCIHPPIDADYIKSHSPEEITEEIRSRLAQGLPL